VKGCALLKSIKTISFALVACLILATTATATPNEGVTRECSRERFIMRLAEIETLDLQTAEARISEFENYGQKGDYSYCEWKSIYDYGNGFTVEAGVLYLLYSDGPSRSISGIVTKWSGAVADGDYTWSEAYYVVDWTPTQILQMVRGRVVISGYTRSLESTRLRTRLQQAGFSDGVVIGDEWHFAKINSWSEVLQVATIPQGVKKNDVNY